MTSPNDPNADGVSRRIALKRGLVVSSTVGFGVPALSGAVVARPPGCDVLVDPSDPGADASTIQGGVDAASPGDTVCVGDGTYTEQVVVNKDLTLTNSPGATPTIERPGDPADFTIAESGPTWEPIVFAFGGSESGGVVSGSGTVDVSVSGFTVDGRDRQPDARRSIGVLLRNVRGTSSDRATIEDNVVENMGVGGRETLGIVAYGDSDLLVRDNAVSGYERGGIGANGDGGTHPAPTVDVVGNAVTGSGDGSGTAWAPNGIQIGFGAEGTIQHNRVEQNRYSDTGQVASGIIVFESDDVTVSNNTVTNSDGALTCGSWGWFRRTAANTKFAKNDVDGAVVGVHLEAKADPFGGAIESTADPTVRNTKIINNDLAQGGTGDSSESIGVQFLTVDNSDDFDPVLANSKVIHNEIVGFAEATDTDAGTDTKEHANPVEP